MIAADMKIAIIFCRMIGQQHSYTCCSFFYLLKLKVNSKHFFLLGIRITLSFGLNNFEKNIFDMNKIV